MSGESDKDQGNGDRVSAGMWGLISTRSDLRSLLGYLGMAAFLVLGLPLAVYRLTLMVPDSKLVPIRTPTVGNESGADNEGGGLPGRQRDGMRDQGGEDDGDR